MRYVEKTILLQDAGPSLAEHLVMLDHLRQVIGLRGYGQRDPLQEYKDRSVQPVPGNERAFARGGHRAADAGRDRAAPRSRRSRCRRWKCTSSIRTPARMRWRSPKQCLLKAIYAQASLVPNGLATDRDPNNPASWGKIGRNEDCPCGSGKRYKHCHGRYA